MDRIWKAEREIYWKGEFDSAHFLILPYKSKCQRLHGHNYEVEIWIRGDLDDRGMIFDYNHLHEIVKSLDHKMLLPTDVAVHENGDAMVGTDTGSFLTIKKGEYVIIGKNVTAEAISEYIALKIVDSAGDNVHYVKVKVWEDPRSYAVFELSI